jgi:hypothetical protein
MVRRNQFLFDFIFKKEINEELEFVKAWMVR